MVWRSTSRKCKLEIPALLCENRKSRLDDRINNLKLLRPTMPATIVLGGQYGSEGKGKVVALLASRSDSPWLVRCGGPNSGHTVTIDGKDVILRQVPSCSEPHRATFCIAAGCAIDEEVLLRELDMLNIDRRQIVVDPRAVIVTDEDRKSTRLNS